MSRTILGIGVTTVVLFFWGFIFWGINTIPYESLQRTADDAQAQAMLRQYFPNPGTYLVPSQAHEPEELTRLAEAGPNAMIHIQAGGSPQDVTTMIAGFLLNLVFVSLLAGFFRMARATDFRDFARLSLVVGAIAVILIDVGDMIWWQESVAWKIWPAIYDFTAFLIAGHLLGVFMKQPSGQPVS